MSKRWLLLIIVAVAVVGFGAGVVVAKEGLKYPYLLEEYSQPYIPTFAEWRALQLTASQNCEGYLSSHLIQTSCIAYVLPSGLELLVGTQTQPEWNMYRGDGHFSCSDREVRSTYQEAADGGEDSIMASVYTFFSQIADKDVTIVFFINSSPVGTWEGGKMTLKGEE